MESPRHSLSALFKQLGLPCDPNGINAFVSTHSPLPAELSLSEASFWSTAQAAFLREEILEDADWAPIVDQLNLLLRQ